MTMKKILSSTYKLVALVILIPLMAFAAVHLLENKYVALPVMNSAGDLYNPSYTFVNQHNQVRSFSHWKNKVLVAGYFFTACPVICPKMINNLKTVASTFKNDSTVQLLSFTVDPKHDLPAKLLAYSTTMQADYARWDFLTGDKAVLYRLARKQFFITATDGDGGPQDFIHSDRLVLIDPKHRIRGYYDGTSQQEVQQLINDIKNLKNEN